MKLILTELLHILGYWPSTQMPAGIRGGINDQLEYMVCARYQCIYISALYPSLFVLENLGLVLIISFANWHDAKLYRSGH